MIMCLVEGLFKYFEGCWIFKLLCEDVCKIEFDMEYEFFSCILEGVIGLVFSMIVNSFVDFFCKCVE